MKGTVAPQYRKWIERMIHERYNGEPWRMSSMCYVESVRMSEAFPELRLAKGLVDVHFSGIGPSPRAHWWLVDSAGSIVDPTAEQWERPLTNYREIEPDYERLGRCMNCGKDIWGPRERGRVSICSEDCERDLVAYLEGRPFRYKSARSESW